MAGVSKSEVFQPYLSASSLVQPDSNTSSNMSSDRENDQYEAKADEAGFNHIEAIRTISRVPGNPNYHEKNGLRTEGDGMNHATYNTGSVSFVMTVLGCSLALAGSQIVPLLYLTLATTIAYDLGAPQLYLWMLTGLIVAMGALAPFVGPLADLLGRKPIFIIGFYCSIGGATLCAATPTAAGFIAGQVFLGFGAIIQELLAIAVVGESVPTAKRPLYAALVLCSIIPWSPGTLYANWIAESNWRWIGLALALWNAANLLIVAAFYRPPPRVNRRGLSRKQLLARIDFVGGILIILGLLFFLIALNWGGIDYPWKSARVLVFLVLGFCFMIAFAIWEWKIVKYPLFPRRIVHAPRPFFCMMFVIFAAGINYVPLVAFWPIESISVFDSDKHQTGINTLPIGICILGGAMVSAVLLGVFKKHITFVMTAFCVMQTVASACLVVINPHDIRTAFPSLVLALIGVGGVLVPNQVVITIITPDDLIASVTALTVGLRSQAQVIGIAIFYNRFVTVVTSGTYKYVVPAMIKIGYVDVNQITTMMHTLTSQPFSEYAQTIPQLTAMSAAGSNFDIVKEATVLTYSYAFQQIYYLTIAFGVTACVAAAFMGDVSQYMDEHVAVVI